MKIQCDVCDENEASVFCAADEAALCGGCDRRVHHANKLVGKHHRFSLHPASAKQSTLCDICQEKRAFLFCQQDRAILCRQCDASIHKANEHTQNHTRFLLTGHRLSSNSTIYSSFSSSPSSGSAAASSDTVPTQIISKEKPVLASPANVNRPSSASCEGSNNVMDSCINSSSSSSISEYFIETLPGWHVEELLVDPNDNFFASQQPHGFCKSGENELGLRMPFWDGDLEGNMSCGLPIGQMGLWAPRFPLL